MSYQVLALKYRPQTFEDVVGQDHVTTTLANAISGDRMAHALLLTGPRGTGKTTIARILAKALACSNGPAPTPCNACKICKDITSGHCADVFEIDGASNNSVDQVRELRENVTYMPASARVKIYIIDEVHMLSTAAFNALLKTLEEPPSHVVFIFATTEVHKIPATILSRCQRHDLSRIPLDQISNHLQILCQKEGYEVEEEGLDLIAMEADGSIRDALSLLDRVLSASPDRTASLRAVQDSLGVMDRQIMADLSLAVFARDGAGIITLIDRVNDTGLDLKKFYADIILHFRNLNVIKLCGPESPGLNLTPAEAQALASKSENISKGYLAILLQLLLDNEGAVKFSSHTRTAVEMVLLKMIQVSQGVDISGIITRLDALAKQVDAGLSAQGSQTSGAPMPPPPQEEPPSPPAPRAREAAMPAPKKTEPTWAGHPQARARETDPSSHGAPAQVAPAASKALSWEAFLGKIQGTLPVIFALLSRGKMTEGKDAIRVALDIRSDFETTRLKNKDKELQRLAKKYLGKSIRINTNEDARQPQKEDENRKAEEKARQEAAMHPFVQEARRLFDGEIIL